MKPAIRPLRGRLLMPALCVGLVLAATLVTAHHSLASYDDDQIVEIDGTLKDTKIANPHTLFWVMVPARGAGAATTVWTVETAGSAFILRSIEGPLRDQFASGQKVRVTLHPARDGGSTGLLVQMQFADGRVLNGVPVK